MGVLSSSFDRTKKTLLMVHGLQPDMVMEQQQFGLDGELDAVLAPWLRLRFNVGVFLWTQFADEEIINFVRSEDQIYTTDSFVKMRYKIKTRRGKIVARDAPLNMSVTDYFIASWCFHWPNDPPGGAPYPEIRIMGHSLGTQVTLNSAYQIYNDETIATKPNRLALLDAVMSPSNKVFYRTGRACGKTVSKNMGCMARTLTEEGKIAIEYYKSSFINRCIFSSREDTDLIEFTAYEVLRMEQWGNHPLGSCWDKRLLHNLKHIKSYMDDIAYQMTAQHIYVVPYYLLSLYRLPHRCLLSRDEKTCTPLDTIALSAAMPTNSVLTWGMPPVNIGGRKLCFHQFSDKSNTTGALTLTPDDDYFYLKRCETAHT